MSSMQPQTNVNPTNDANSRLVELWEKAYEDYKERLSTYETFLLQYQRIDLPEYQRRMRTYRMKKFIGNIIAYLIAFTIDLAIAVWFIHAISGHPASDEGTVVGFVVGTAIMLVAILIIFPLIADRLVEVFEPDEPQRPEEPRLPNLPQLAVPVAPQKAEIGIDINFPQAGQQKSYASGYTVQEPYVPGERD